MIDEIPHRVVFVSPHLDDAVFSCGALIEALVSLDVAVDVLTVCAGVPGPLVSTQLDEAAGFALSAAAMETRRAEDETAVGLLGARPVHLDALDQQYGGTAADAADLLNAYLARNAGVIVGPVGIRHPDHVTVRAALNGRPTFLYDDLPYAALWPEQHPSPGRTPAMTVRPTNTKMAAIGCYRSQVGPGGPGEGLLGPEHYYRP